MVHIIDAIMGAGKTSSAINYINQNRDTKHFIYVTPYLEEVKRIKEQCGFHEPIKYNDTAPKIINFKDALKEQKNIVTTHALFSLFDEEVVDICRAYNYELIMDEVHDVVDVLGISSHDMDILLNECVDINEDGLLTWREDMADYDGAFTKYKLMCDNGSLGYYSKRAMVWLFPVKLFAAFSDAYILTYLFDCQIQKYYFDYYNLEYDYMYITPDYCFTTEKQEYKLTYDILNLIHVVDANDKLNTIGKGEYALSKQWYKRNATGIVKQLKTNLKSFYRKKAVKYTENGFDICCSNDCLWTTFSDFQEVLSGDGYTKGFVSCNMKATNEYKDRSVVAYPINRFINPIIVNFFKLNKVAVDEDNYAISEMIQFIWRSAIRDGNHITLYIPSGRMYTLLIRWLSFLTGETGLAIREKIEFKPKDIRTNR